MTKPYGWRPMDFTGDDWGPSSKHAQIRNRRRLRQLLHKRGRKEAEGQIEEQLKEMDEPEKFKCRYCGEWCYMQEKCGCGCGNCLWCWDNDL